MLGQIDAHGLGGDLVLADGLERAAVAGVYEQHDEEDAQSGDGEHDEGRKPQHDLAVRVGDVEIRERREAVEGVRAVGNAAQVLPLEYGADYLGKAQSGYGEVVALELEDGQAYQPGHEGGHQAGDYNYNQDAEDESHCAAHTAAAKEVLQRLGYGEVYCGAVVHVVHAFTLRAGYGEYGIGVAAQEHEAGLAKREKAGESVKKVHADGDEGVHRALLEGGKDYQVAVGVEDVLEHYDSREDYQHAQEGDDSALLALFFKCNSRHRAPPQTLSVAFSPNRPVGLTTRMTMSRTNVTASEKME